MWARGLLNFFKKLFIYLWLCWVFVSVRGLSLVAASGGHSSSRCMGLSLSRPLPLRSTGSRHAGSIVVAHGPSCAAACGILPDQGSNPCPLHWQADSQPLRHQGSPGLLIFISILFWHMNSQVSPVPYQSENHIHRESHSIHARVCLLSCLPLPSPACDRYNFYGSVEPLLSRRAKCLSMFLYLAAKIFLSFFLFWIMCIISLWGWESLGGFN